MRLRQVAFVARELDAVVDDLCSVLGIEVAYRDPGVEAFGLTNAVMPIGDTFLEVVSPVKEDTTAGRLLTRRGGDGGYMVILQTDDLESDRQRVSKLGVRVVFEINQESAQGIHLHPRDVGGAILSLDTPEPAESWPYAGPEWKTHVRRERVRSLVGAELQADDPAAMARRWAEVLDREARPISAGSFEIALDGSRLRFAPVDDGRGEGVSGITLEAADAGAVRAAARERGLAGDDDVIRICGTRVTLV